MLNILKHELAVMLTSNRKQKALLSASTTVAVSMAVMLVLSASPIANTGLAFAASDRMMSDKMMMDGGATTFRGQIANVQLENGQPAWVQSGFWVLRVFDERVSFIAKMHMIMPDGTASHMHAISKLIVDSHSYENNIHTIIGTATISMRGENVDNVPITIKIMNDAVISLIIGPDKVDGHFGTMPIYGTVAPSNAAMMKERSMMMDNKLTKTSVPVTIPLTKGFVNGNEVFYISTEASDKQLAEDLTKLTGFRVAYTPALTKAPADSLANIYAFSNGIAGPGPLGFQPNVADSQPGDAKYSPLWRINVVEWQSGATPKELRSESEILAASSAGEVKITPTEFVVNCPFVEWEGGSLPIRENKNLTDDAPYGGGQVLSIDKEKMQVTFVAHRGFAPNGDTIYYIATDASVKEVADALGVIHVEKTGNALYSSASSDLWVFTNGIVGTGPMGFQASIAGSNVGDAAYSPLWRINAATWKDPAQAKFLMTAEAISSESQLTTEIAGVVVNCPFVEVK